jgi:cbb3-type cytochrome oxidase subunit 1
MKHFLSILFWGVVFALVWAAGHDILKGESDVWLEWTVVVTGLLLAVSVLGYKIRKLKRGGRA